MPMSFIPQIIKTEYLWDNRSSVEERYRALGIPVNEDEVVEEWRDIAININTVSVCYNIPFMLDEELLNLTEVVLNTADCKSLIINVDYDEFCEILSGAICDQPSLTRNTIQFNNDEQ